MLEVWSQSDRRWLVRSTHAGTQDERRSREPQAPWDTCRDTDRTSAEHCGSTSGTRATVSLEPAGLPGALGACLIPPPATRQGGGSSILLPQVLLGLSSWRPVLKILSEPKVVLVGSFFLFFFLKNTPGCSGWRP